MKTAKSILAAVMFAGTLVLALAPTSAQAQDEPGIFTYGFRGFFTGAEIGLAAGYLSTGSSYESGEWRNMVYGVGVGALVGVSAGLVLGITDASSDPPPTGWYVLRDMGYGTLFGALIGTTVGLLFFVSSEEPRDIVSGAAYGALFGAAAGIAFGILESSSESRRRGSHAANSGATLQLAIMPNPESRVPLAGLRLIL